MAKVIDGLVSKTARQRAVADHGNNIVVFFLEISCPGHTDGRGDRCRAVTGIESVILGLVNTWESGDTALLAESIEFIVSAGKKLIGIRLVSDVEHDLVFGVIEYGKQSDRQLDDAQVTRKMPAVGRHCLKDLIAQFGAQLFPVLVGQRSDRLRRHILFAEKLIFHCLSVNSPCLSYNLQGPYSHQYHNPYRTAP